MFDYKTINCLLIRRFNALVFLEYCLKKEGIVKKLWLYPSS